MDIKKKTVDAFKDGSLYKHYNSIIEAIYDLHISYPSIRKSVRTGSYIRGFTFSDSCKSLNIN